MMASPRCRCCGSTRLTLLGRKPGEFIKRDFEFHVCGECELIFVEPFSGFEIYNEAYYRGAGPDPYVDYQTEYRDWRLTDRGLEFQDLARIAERHMRESSEQRVTSSEHPAVVSSTRHSLPTTRYSPLRWLDFGCGAGGFLKFLRERSHIAGHALELHGHDVGSYAEMLKRAD